MTVSRTIRVINSCLCIVSKNLPDKFSVTPDTIPYLAGESFMLITLTAALHQDLSSLLSHTVNVFTGFLISWILGRIRCCFYFIFLALLSVSEEVRIRCHLSPVAPSPLYPERSDVFLTPHSTARRLQASPGGTEANIRSLPSSVSHESRLE